MKKGIAVGIIAMFIISLVSPIVIGLDIGESDNIEFVSNYDCYNVYEISNPEYIRSLKEYNKNDTVESEITINLIETSKPLDGLMNSSWPMYCHDTRHAGRSPYSTVDIWDEIWNFETKGWATSGPIIDENGTIYI